MKKLLLLLSLVLFGVSMSAQSPDMDSPKVRNGLWFEGVFPKPQANKRNLKEGVLYFNGRHKTFEFTADDTYISALPTIKVTDITAAQINAGDSITLLTAPGSDAIYVVDKVIFILDAGTAYVQEGTDSTFVSTVYQGSSNKVMWLSDEYFTDTVDKIENLPFIGGIDENSVMWIKFADGYTTGTGTMKVCVYYFVYESN